MPAIMIDDPDTCRAASTEVSVAVRAASPLWRRRLPDAPALLERATHAALAAATAQGVRPGGALEISFLLADDARVRRLNRDYRGQDKATNVLSFPAEADDPEGRPGGCGTGPRLLGDVALACETLEREAASQSKALADHLSHLAVHGVLHLLGFDHAEAPEAGRMERLETQILAGLGIADPYAPAGRPGEAAP